MAVYSVSQISRYLKESLERDSLLRDLWISGEVSNLSRSGAGHYYFTLKDQTGALRCVMFKPARGAELLTNGAAVLVHGKVSFYEARGDIQVYADIVQPEGVGEIHLRLEQLKLKLEKEGLFEPSRKRQLPAFPRRLGVVTSPTGAVFHDIQNVVRRRFPLVELVLAPTPVQGNEAADGIVEAFQVLSEEDGIDVIIVARGGGSLEELMPFNEEKVAYAVFRSKAPVISGVGHETDFTICDMVADVRAPTPSAAAELAVPDRRQLLANVLNWEQTLYSIVSDRLSEMSGQWQNLYERLQDSAPDIAERRLRIDDMLRDSMAYVLRYVNTRQEQLSNLGLRLNVLSPTSVLSRGYAIVEKGDGAGEVVRKVAQVSAGDSIKVTVSDGSFGAEVVKPQQQKNGDAEVRPQTNQTLAGL